jgi:uncharacterized protein YkvS
MIVDLTAEKNYSDVEADSLEERVRICKS